MKSMNISKMNILNELSEFITLRMKSFHEVAHDGKWMEHKAHMVYDLWFIQSGTVIITIDGQEHIAKAGDVVFFYPRMPYMAKSTEKGCRFIYVHFDFDIGGQQRILHDFTLSGIVPNHLIGRESSLFITSYTQSKQPNKLSNQLLLKGYLMAVVAKIIELHELGQYTGVFSTDQTRTSKGNLELLQPVFDYINDHLHQSIKIKELASLIGMSEKYFIAYFKKGIGITPGQYINQIKMNRARDYLYQKRFTVQQIASLLGYSDAFSFSNAFKKYYQVSPSKFD